VANCNDPADKDIGVSTQLVTAQLPKVRHFFARYPTLSPALLLRCIDFKGYVARTVNGTLVAYCMSCTDSQLRKGGEASRFRTALLVAVGAFFEENKNVRRLFLA